MLNSDGSVAPHANVSGGQRQYQQHSDAPAAATSGTTAAASAAAATSWTSTTAVDVLPAEYAGSAGSEQRATAAATIDGELLVLGQSDADDQFHSAAFEGQHSHASSPHSPAAASTTPSHAPAEAGYDAHANAAAATAAAATTTAATATAAAAGNDSTASAGLQDADDDPADDELDDDEQYGHDA